MDITLKGYSFLPFRLSSVERYLLSSFTPSPGDGAEEMLIFAQILSKPITITRVKPAKAITIPFSYRGETTIRYAGVVNDVSSLPDKFGNATITLGESSAIMVQFYTIEHPNGRQAVYTTLLP